VLVGAVLVCGLEEVDPLVVGPLQQIAEAVNAQARLHRALADAVGAAAHRQPAELDAGPAQHHAIAHRLPARRQRQTRAGHVQPVQRQVRPGGPEQRALHQLTAAELLHGRA
jgi:hypothetical protein